MTATLHHTLVSGPSSRAARTVVVLHGILGSGKNWRGFCRRLLRARPEWQFVLPDLRHHGQSQGATGPNTVEACVEDVNALCDANGWRPAVVIGHSFGGKVALATAAKLPTPAQSVWALDTPPGRRGAGARGPGSEVGRVLATLEAIPTPVATREEVHQGLLEAGFSPALGAWMTTNLRATDDGFVWRFDLEAVEALITDYFDLDLWPAIRAWPSHTHLNLLAAGQGGRWTSLDRTLAKAAAASGGVRFFTLPESGHWVHVDAPDALAGLLVADLAEIESKMAS